MIDINAIMYLYPCCQYLTLRMMLVRVRHQQHILILVHIVFRVEIVGNSFENT